MIAIIRKRRSGCFYFKLQTYVELIHELKYIIIKYLTIIPVTGMDSSHFNYLLMAVIILEQRLL